ncbi:hypothetical protein SBA4_3470019 [Candidatus Sulfopaludibacter sp. SbA4]|nr:hypothetical protein SBA4_3470019 [Candidatus Sulfopaludibacter sp. SbA4]
MAGGEALTRHYISTTVLQKWGSQSWLPPTFSHGF